MDLTNEKTLARENKTTTVSTNTYENIKQNIIFGYHKPGTKLKLEQLQKHYDVSITTLREVLSGLAREQFVISVEQRGFFVANISKKDLIEISDLRIFLECNALKASIENGDMHWESNLVAAYHKLYWMETKMLQDNTQKNMVKIWKQFDWQFHLAMICACNSKNLLNIHSNIFDKYLRYQMLVLTYRGEEAVKEHKAMFDATLKKDIKLAQSLLEEHIKNGLRHTIERISITKN